MIRPDRLAAWLPRQFGMLGVLLLLCAALSLLTIAEQHPTGAAAGTQVAEAALAGGSAPRVLVAAGDSAEEAAFAQSAEERLRAGGARVAAVIRGEPQDARRTLVQLAAQGQPLDAVAASSAAARWLVLVELPRSFPALGQPRLYAPAPYRWPTFLKRDNLLNIANQIAVIAIVAIGMTLVIITRCIDLSVGSLIALSAVTAARLIRDLAGGTEATAAGMLVCSLAAILLCGLIGASSGLAITALRIPPFIVTLAVMWMASGAAFIVSSGQSVYQVPESYVWLGRGADLARIPNAVLLMGLLYALAHGLMSRTVIGRHVYAVGGNPEAARLSGIRVQRVLLFAYAMSGLLAGLGGVVLASNLKSGAPTYGQSYELYTIAAVVVGGTSLSGGEGSILGTLVGALIIAVIQNGMNLADVEPNAQRIVLGAVILLAALLDALKRRK